MMTVLTKGGDYAVVDIIVGKDGEIVQLRTMKFD